MDIDDVDIDDVDIVYIVEDVNIDDVDIVDIDDVNIVECRPFEEEKLPIIGKLSLSPWFILLVPQ